MRTAATVKHFSAFRFVAGKRLGKQTQFGRFPFKTFQRRLKSRESTPSFEPAAAAGYRRESVQHQGNQLTRTTPGLTRPPRLFALLNSAFNGLVLSEWNSCFLRTDSILYVKIVPMTSGRPSFSHTKTAPSSAVRAGLLQCSTGLGSRKRQF